MTILLSELLKHLYGDQYGENVGLTTSFANIFATDEDIVDAHIMAKADRRNQGFEFWLAMILSKNNRIPFSPYDDENIDC